MMIAEKMDYRQLIHSLSQRKLAHNQAKIQNLGYHDIDDHGNIPWDEPIPFERVSNHPDGGSYGARCIGENFYRWLDVHPVYINPDSSLAGAWVCYVPEMGGWPTEDRPVHLYPLHKKYHIVSSGIGAGNHLGPDMTLGLELGWGGLLDKIRHYRRFNQPASTDFYDGEELLVTGIRNWMRKHVTKARAMAQAAETAFRRENLLSIADMNEWLVDNPPRTLREACQFLAWFQSVDRMWGAGGGLGQLDELLRPFYEADLRAGIHNDEAAIWHIASLFINDTHYSQIGGPAPDGHDLASPLSFLILEAVHQLKIPMNLAVRVHENIDPQLLRRALEYHMADGTGVCFSLSGGLDPGFARNGFPIGLARMRAKVGCNWTALPGIEYSLQDVTRQCLTTPLLLALDDLVGETGNPQKMEELWERYVYHLNFSVNLMREGFDWHMAHQGKDRPEIVLNLFCHGPIERGLDVAEGGVDIVNIAVDGIGLAVVADSFAAIEQRVVEEQRLTWQELMQQLKNNFAGAERVRLMLRSSQRYGSGGSRGDRWAQRIAQTYAALVKTKRTPNGYNVIPGLFSHGDILMQGRDLGATPNGRLAGTAISHSTNPDPGFARDGSAAPTAKANAVASTQPAYGNSAPLQLDVDSHLMQESGGLEALEALIKTHNKMGGTLINLNVVSKEKILAAHADPSQYPDLVVRVTGYSAYFHSLSPEYRQQIVDRFLGKAASA
jgi:formate C-acetyltransferase